MSSARATAGRPAFALVNGAPPVRWARAGFSLSPTDRYGQQALRRRSQARVPFHERRFVAVTIPLWLADSFLDTITPTKPTS